MKINFAERIHDIKEILDAMNSVGGHIVVALGVGLFGIVSTVGAVIWAWPDKELAAMISSIMGPASGFLAIASYAMSGRGSANGKTVSSTTESTTETKTTEEKK